MAAPLRERTLPDVVVGDRPVAQLAVLVRRGADGPEPPASLGTALRDLGLDLAEVLADATFSAKPGSVLPVQLPAPRRARYWALMWC